MLYTGRSENSVLISGIRIPPGKGPVALLKVVQKGDFLIRFTVTTRSAVNPLKTTPMAVSLSQTVTNYLRSVLSIYSCVAQLARQ